MSIQQIYQRILAVMIVWLWRFKREDYQNCSVMYYVGLPQIDLPMLLTTTVRHKGQCLCGIDFSCVIDFTSIHRNASLCCTQIPTCLAFIQQRCILGRQIYHSLRVIQTQEAATCLSLKDCGYLAPPTKLSSLDIVTNAVCQSVCVCTEYLIFVPYHRVSTRWSA